jgi:hypothetical protein
MTGETTPTSVAAGVATTIGTQLAHTVSARDRDDAAEITAITDAMVRLLVGSRSDLTGSSPSRPRLPRLTWLSCNGRRVSRWPRAMRSGRTTGPAPWT